MENYFCRQSNYAEFGGTCAETGKQENKESSGSLSWM
jgi:hypothetical protein